MSKFAAWGIGIAILTLVSALVTGIYYDTQRMNMAEAIEKETGCEYLGRARDLAGIAFFDCDGTVILKRIKVK